MQLSVTYRGAENTKRVKLRSKDSEMPASEIMENMLKKVAEMSREEVIPGLKNTSGDDVTLLCLEIENKVNCHQERLKPSNSEDLLVLKSEPPPIQSPG